MPKQYRRYMNPAERGNMRKDLLKITKEDDKVENRFKKTRLKIEDIKDGECYQSERFFDDPNSTYATQCGSVLLIKAKDRYTIVFPDQKLECQKLEPEHITQQKMERMDHKLDARRKQNEYERIIQDKTKKIQALPNISIAQQNLSDSDSDANKPFKKKDKQKKKEQHRMDYSDSESNKQKKVKPNGGVGEEQSSQSDEFSQDSQEISKESHSK